MDTYDFYTLYNENTLFEDPVFAHDETALSWEDAGETYVSKAEAEGAVWHRAKDVFPNKTLWGGHGITPHDIRQGDIGNCWFIAGASALSEVPGRMEKIFLNTLDETSPAGIYGVNLFVLGQPHTIIVDDYLPVLADGKGGWNTHAS